MCVCACTYVCAYICLYVCLVRFELVCTETHVSSTRSHYTIRPPPSYVCAYICLYVCLVSFELVCTETSSTRSSTRSHYTIRPPPSSLLPTHNVHGRWWEDPDLNSYHDMMVCSGAMCEYFHCHMMVPSNTHTHTHVP